MSEKNVIAKSKIWIIGFLLLLGFGSVTLPLGNVSLNYIKK